MLSLLLQNIGVWGNEMPAHSSFSAEHRNKKTHFGIFVLFSGKVNASSRFQLVDCTNHHEVIRYAATRGCLDDTEDVSIEDRTIKRVDHTKSLGLTTDAQLSWSKHVDEISKKVSSAIGALKRVRPFIPTDVAAQIYNALMARFILETDHPSGTNLGKER